eukprot:m.383770 g.383770  ORF g.383770 m.383770 type:complete len:398 (-) comp20047_c1_seq17:39-1232(-)
MAAGGGSSPLPAAASSKSFDEVEQGFFPVMQEHTLLAELKLAGEHAVPGVYVRVSLSSNYAWDGVIFIRSGIYEGGVFKFRVLIPAGYPNKDVPRVFFQSASLFHPQVDEITGEVNISKYFPSWNPRSDRLWHLLKIVKMLFYTIETSEPRNEEAAALFRSDEAAFRTKAQLCATSADKDLYAQTANAVRFKQWKEAYSQVQSIMMTWESRKQQQLRENDEAASSAVHGLLGRYTESRKRGNATEQAATAVSRELASIKLAQTMKREKDGVHLRQRVKGELGGAADTTDVCIKEAECTGWLSKLDASGADWQRRWIVMDLESRRLSFAESDKSSAAKEGSVSLVDVYKAFQPEQPEMKASNTFVVVTPLNTLQFRAPSVNAMRVWMHVLNIVADKST